MMTLCVLYGSRSCEHDVAVVTALQFMEQVDAAKYEVVPVYITREGEWFTGDVLKKVEAYRPFKPDAPGLTRCFIDPNAGTAELLGYPEKKLLGGGGKRVIKHIDVAVPIMHGVNGEDGTLQGLLELADIPYTSSGVLGSSVGMDKIAMKALFRGCGFPVVDYCAFDRMDWQTKPQEILARIESELTYPLFVKPANMGSSIGITPAKDRESLKKGIEVAIQYDRRILVECGVSNLKEINCSALGWGDDVRASVCEQPVAWESFLTFDDKYLRGGKGGAKGKAPGKAAAPAKGQGQGMESMGRRIPADINHETSMRIQALTCDIFRALDCKGVVRIDYMIDTESGNLYVNEINTIPGSMAFYLWEHEGVSYSQLIDKLVECALSAHVDKQKNVFSFDSSILEKFTGQMGK